MVNRGGDDATEGKIKNAAGAADLRASVGGTGRMGSIPNRPTHVGMSGQIRHPHKSVFYGGSGVVEEARQAQEWSQNAESKRETDRTFPLMNSDAAHVQGQNQSRVQRLCDRPPRMRVPFWHLRMNPEGDGDRH